MRFDALPIDPAILDALEAMGFEEATPVQEETLPALLEGRDVIAQAQTGTGKTAAFGIPLVEAARAGRRGLVLTPTRELAKQVQREVQSIGKGSPVDVVCLIGGASFPDQVRALQRHPDAVLVATPGRVVDHLGRGTLDLSKMSILVLDEADEMLSMGFADELDTIVAAIPEERQSMLFTATLHPAIEKLARNALKDPVTVRAKGGSKGAASTVEQCFALVRQSDRADAVRRLLEAGDPKAALLFCKTRGRVEDLANELRDVGAEALHGGMGQPIRDAVMKRFRDGRTRLLVATDVAARGLDVEDVELVLHDEPATDTETYIHRVGRTGRAGRAGRSVLMLGPAGMKRLSAIQRTAGRLEKIEIPTDADLAALRRDRIVADLAELEPGPNAQSVLDRALASGMDLRGVAVRALELLLAADIEKAEQADADEADDGATAALALKVGLMDNVRPGDLVGMLANEGGLRGEQVGRIDLLPRMSVVEVPARELPRLLSTLERSTVKGRAVRPREAEDWRFKNQPR